MGHMRWGSYVRDFRGVHLVPPWMDEPGCSVEIYSNWEDAIIIVSIGPCDTALRWVFRV